MNNKYIKKMLCFVLCFTMVFGLVACSNNEEVSPTQDLEDNKIVESDNISTEPTDNTENIEDKTNNNEINLDNYEETYRENTPEYVAQNFFKSLLESDYENALKCFKGSDAMPFFTEADIEWYLPRSDYADVLNINYEDYIVSVYVQNSELGKAECLVHVDDNDSDSGWTFKAYLKLNLKNEWVIDDENFFIKEYYLVVPGDSTLTIDGVEVSDEYKHSKYGSAKLRQLYKIENIGKSEKIVAVHSESTFGTVEENIYAIANYIEDPYLIHAYYNEDAGYQALSDLWIGFYNGLQEGKTYSDMMYLMSPTADSKTAETIMSSIEQLTENGTNSDFIISNVREMADPEWKSEYLTSNIITMAFNYTITWIETDSYGSDTRTMNNYDNLLLHYDGETWTIHQNYYNVFFGFLSYMTNQSK